MEAGDAPEAVLDSVAADGPLLAHHGIRFVSAREGRAVVQAKAMEVMVNAGGRTAGRPRHLQLCLTSDGIFNFALRPS